jgi:hypothetical protein
MYGDYWKTGEVFVACIKNRINLLLKTNSVVWVHERTTKRPQIVREVSANFCG